MKLLVFCSREDETELYHRFNRSYGFDITFTKEYLNANNVHRTRGYEAIAILTSCRIDRSLTYLLKEYGVRYVLSRAAGTDHMDLKAMEEAGLKSANVPSYSPTAIAEHSVMLMLMLLRHMKQEMQMVENRNFTLDGLRGRELKEMTVGIYGLGKIGTAEAAILKGFGCRVLAYDCQKNPQASQIAEFVAEEELYRQSDILSFHCPLNEQTKHLLSKNTISGLKDGVCLINTARGGLFNYSEVMQGLKDGKIGGLAMDVYEGENQFMRKDLAGREPEDPVFKELLGMKNVIFTAHIGFYTEQAIASMIETSLKNLHEFVTAGVCTNQLT